MDYNDITSRLKRIFSSLKDGFEEDVEKHTNVEEWKNGKGVTLTYGKYDEEELLNKIMSILYNLASLKDNLKNNLEKNGFNPQIVEDEINNSLHLQVLIDIVNQDKHGSPLRKPRSHKNPVIKYPNIGFRPFFKKKGTATGNSTEDIEKPVMFIDALIKDEHENILFYLDEFVETCFAKWKALAQKYNCV